MQPSYNPCKVVIHTHRTITTQSIVVGTSWQSTQPKTRITLVAGTLLDHYRVVSPRSSTRKVSQTAQLCSAWNSFSAVNSYVKGIISHRMINHKLTKQLPSQVFHWLQSRRSHHLLSQTCLFQQNLTSLRSLQRHEPQLQTTLPWLLKLTLRGAKTLPVQQRRRAVLDWQKSLHQTVVKASKPIWWWTKRVEVSSNNANDHQTQSIIPLETRIFRHTRIPEAQRANHITRLMKRQVVSCTARLRRNSKMLLHRIPTLPKRFLTTWTSRQSLPCWCVSVKSVVMSRNLNWSSTLTKWYSWLNTTIRMIQSNLSHQTRQQTVRARRRPSCWHLRTLCQRNR